MMLGAPELLGVGALLTSGVRRRHLAGGAPDSWRNPPEAPIGALHCRFSSAGPLRNAPHVVEQRLLDLADDLERLALLALPDVAAEDHAGAARLHDRAGVREDRPIVGLRSTGEDH